MIIAGITMTRRKICGCSVNIFIVRFYLFERLSQVILDFDVKTELTSTFDVIPTIGRNLEYKPTSEQQRFLPLVEMTVHLKFNLCCINSHERF